MSNNVKIRMCESSDIGAIANLFYETIQSVNRKDYSQGQVDDWSSWHNDLDRWQKQIEHQFFIVATLNEIVVGFGSLRSDGYLDYLFVHKDYQNIGVAKKLVKAIKEKAVAQHTNKIYTDVSITALPFFESKGYLIEQKKLKRSKEKYLLSYRMTKLLI